MTEDRTVRREPCGTCGNEYTVTANGTIRHHLTENPDLQAGPDSRKCKGAGEPPAGAAPLALAEDMEADGPQCRLCRHPVQLTDNGRARSHLTPEATPRPCPAGSDFPLGTYPEIVGTTDGRVATLEFDCDHCEVGACHACQAALSEPLEAGDLTVRTTPCEGVTWGGAAEARQTMADQLKATPLTDLLTKEVRSTGTVLDVMPGDMRAEAERFMAAAIPEQPATTVEHAYTDSTGVQWVHPGLEDKCRTPECSEARYRRSLPEGFDPNCEQCNTNTHRCPGCGEDVKHGTVACADCARETHRAGCGCPEDDGWRTPLDLMEKMPEDVRGLDALRLNCAACGHPVTPLVEAFDLYGKAKSVLWCCEPAQNAGTLSCDNGGHECKPDARVLLGHLESDEHFFRHGVLMRVTGEVNGVVKAIVVEGPHKGRTGELMNLGETVERTYCRHSYYEDVDEENGRVQDRCEYCDPTKEQEIKECVTESRISSPTSPTTAPAPGSRPPTKASAPAVSPKSQSVTSSAPTAKAGTKVRSAAVAESSTTDQADAAAQFLAGAGGSHGEKETKRDRFGRYLIPHPDTGKEQSWTRATTFAKSISDTYALGQWGLRMCLLGATQRPDIVRRAHGKHVRADKKLLDELTAELKDAAGAKVAANDGTAMHSFTEMVDRAWHSPGGPRSVMNQVPSDCREMVETYIRLLEETGLEPVSNLIEFTTVVKQYGVAGTSDNCYRTTKPLTLTIGRGAVQFQPGEYVIGDKKTGRDLDYGWQEHAIQLSTYAQGINTSGVWDRHEEKWHPDPLNGAKVRTDAGVIIHLPVDKESEKTPTVYGLDLESGWNAAVLCERVRTWRSVRKLAAPVMVAQAADTFEPRRAQPSEPAVTSRTTVRPPTLKERANRITSKGEASAVWKEATDAGMPKDEVAELVRIMQNRLAELTEPAG
jgi:hypothetical protein